MLGIRLFIHAFNNLFLDFGATLRITLLPLVLGYGLVFGLNYLMFGAEFYQVMRGQLLPTQATQLYFLALIVMIVVLTPTFCWSAIAWHRFVLLQERPTSLLPKTQWSKMASYIWAFIKISLVGLIVLIPIMLFINQFRIVIFANPFAPPLLMIALFYILILPAWAAFFRLALMLPASAIGKPLTLRESWIATKGYFWGLMGIALIVVALRMATGFVSGSGAIELMLFAVLSWFGFAFGVSLLTSLYAVCVDKQEL